jgi:hypothetical protein
VSTRSTRRTVLCAAAALAACSALTGGATSASAGTTNQQQADPLTSSKLLALQSQQWAGWQHAPEAGLTFDTPAVTTYNNKLYAFVRGTDNGLHFASFQRNNVGRLVFDSRRRTDPQRTRRHDL